MGSTARGLERTEPLITEGAIRFLERWLQPHFSVLEFGAGASTLYFARKLTRGRLVSLEHAPWWAQAVSEQLESSSCASCAAQCHLARRPYNRSSHVLDGTPPGYDLVFIDGRDRVACARTACHLIRPGGVLMLDNSERPKYHPILSLMHGFRRVDAWQRGPDAFGFFPRRAGEWRTTWWTLPIHAEFETT